MQEPAEGWPFVEAKFRDEAKLVFDNGGAADKSMVEHSEALLLDQYYRDQIAMEADRLKRENQQIRFFTLRPELREGDAWRQDRGDPGKWLSIFWHPNCTHTMFHVLPTGFCFIVVCYFFLS
jgi:hypothetical protein